MPVQAQDAIKMIQDAYAIIDQLQISVTGLLIIGAILVAILLFTTRELVTWFFKIDSLKKDVRDLRSTTTQLETEIKSLQVVLKEMAASKEQQPEKESKFEFQISH